MPPTAAATATDEWRQQRLDAQQQQQKHERAIRRHADADAMLALSAMLRRGAPSVRRDEARAQQQLQRAATQRRSTAALLALVDGRQMSPHAAVPRAVAADHVHEWNNVELAILLSEHAAPSAPLLSRVHAMFSDGVRCHAEFCLLWLPLHLRQTPVALPVCGNANRISQAVMVELDLRQVAALNLSSLLLERHAILPDAADVPAALSLLESAIASFDDHLARLNLAYVLWYGVAGVQPDPHRALHRVEAAVVRSPHHLARALLSCMLAERHHPDHHPDDLPRAVELSKHVTRALRDVTELRRLAALMSPRAAHAIVSYS